MKTIVTLGRKALALLAVIGVAAIGAASTSYAASKTAPGINENTTALFNHAPPTNIAAIMLPEDTAGIYANALLAPDPTLSAVTSKTDGAISTNSKDTGITVAAVIGSPQTATISQKTDQAVPTGNTAHHATNHTANTATNTGPDDGSGTNATRVFLVPASDPAHAATLEQ